VAEWLRLALAMCGAAAIIAGAVACIGQMIRASARHVRGTTAAARLELARYLALALEFQLAADVIETSLTPDWTTIGRLAAIGAIRTALNYFLSRDMNEDRRLVQARGQAGQATSDVNSR
jgi:uncharacterized membrane protein